MKKADEILSNVAWLPIVLTLGFLGWCWKFDFITVPLLGIFCLLIFIFCSDIKNIIPPVISVPFFINEITDTKQLIPLCFAIGFFVIGAIYFITKQFLYNKSNLKKGKMFWAFVTYTIAQVTGGLFGYFNILNFIIVLSLCVTTYFIYWLSINFCKNLKLFINITFIAISIILCEQLLIEYLLVDGNFTSAILSKNVIFIGLQNINVVAIYFMLGMMACFQLAIKHKRDYLYCLLAMWFAICTYFTYSRMGTLICFIFMVISLLYIFIKSKNKPIFLFICIVLLFIFEITLTIWMDKLSNLLDWHMNLGVSGNGRDSLWPWCIERFLASPVFGVGYTSNIPVPSLMTTDSIILAHNTILQWLTSLGVFGTLLMFYFTLTKYFICFKGINQFKLFNILSILIIALSGITDQSPTMDLFIISISVILITLAETDTTNNKTTKSTNQEQTNPTQSLQEKSTN